MNTESLMRNAKVLLRAERILADIRLRQALRRSGFAVAAGAVGLFGAAMLAVSGFLALEQLVGAILAAAIVGAVALVLAGVLAAAAGRVRPGRELAVAESLEAAAFEALMADVKALEGEVAGFTRIIRNPLDGALGGLVVPLATLLMKTLRRKDDAPK